MNSQRSTEPRSRRGSNVVHPPTTADDAPLPPDEAAKVNRVRNALERGEYAMDRAVDVTVDRVIADLYGKQGRVSQAARP